VGLVNPRANDLVDTPELALDDALSTRVPGSSGWRLWQMCRELNGMTAEEYRTSFRRMNVIGPCASYPGQTVVLLGEEARKLFGSQRGLVIRRLLIHPQRIGSFVVRQLPHPSGRCTFYNSPLNRRLAAEMLCCLVAGQNLGEEP
jgi:hypothetical protein